MEKLKIHCNVLSDELIYRIRDFPRNKPEHRVNLTSWPQAVTGVSGPIMLFDIDGPLKEDLKNHLSPIMDTPPGDYNWAFIYTLGSRLSFIPWHDDGGRIRACTVYLNPQWVRDWAGMFVYEHGPNDFRAIYPEYNKAIVLYPPIQHTTVMPAIDAPMRESLQVFVTPKGASGGY